MSISTYAIIEAGGEQLRVEPGRFYDIRFPHAMHESYRHAKFIFSRVLMIRHESTTFIGKPWLQHTLVKGRIFHSRREDKILVYKMRPKKKTRKKRTHRQPLVRFLVDTISFQKINNYIGSNKINSYNNNESIIYIDKREY